MTNPALPPVVYLPTGDRSGDETSVELRRTEDGRTALLAYSALDRLVDGCGQHQPWAMVRTEHLDKLYEAHPYDVIMLDGAIPEELRHPRPGA
ncbi:SAV_915 family protein [Qaidamihabitans albus]|uniref:SAV_915 family protein n=1 Tax=Qaidamihabitans albus TaxID=2795733 RepID=UPI0018F1B5C2|nr:SAV_915 family protein [Qaidamihabitans albus]